MLGELLVEHGVRGARPPVRQHGEGEAAADGPAVDGGEHRKAEALEGGEGGEGVHHDRRQPAAHAKRLFPPAHFLDWKYPKAKGRFKAGQLVTSPMHA